MSQALGEVWVPTKTDTVFICKSRLLLIRPRMGLTFIFLGKRMSISSHEAFVVSSYSKRGPGRNSMSFSPDVYQIFRIPGLSQIYYIRICILIRPPR